MRITLKPMVLLGCTIAIMVATAVIGQDWPQWRGPNRDAHATGFEAPATWPEQLAEIWKVTVGDGVASPSLVRDKLYVFSRQEGNEILRCLNAATGDEIWKQQYEAEPVTGPASRYDGPRATPTVAEGKVVTLGAQGMLSCFDAETGDLVWRNNENVGNTPRFATSSSPIVTDGLVITEFGSDENGGLAAYDLSTGNEKWKWTGSGATYGSPVQMTIGGGDAIICPMADKMVVLAAADGKLLWEMPYKQGRYNSATPIVNDSTLIMAGPTSGFTALKLTMQGDELVPNELWKNTDNSVGFNTPVVKDGRLYGISGLNSLFCIDIENGQTLWNAPLGGDEQAQAEQGGGRRRGGDGEAQAGQDRGERRGGGRRGRGGRRGGGGRGFGSVVDAGSVLLALIQSGQLTVFAPGDEFSQIATYKVADAETLAYPVPSRFGLFIKDQNSLSLLSTK